MTTDQAIIDDVAANAVDETPTDAPEKTPDAQEPADQAENENEPEEIEFPKKAVNALNRKKREKAKLYAQKRELEARVAELEAAAAKASQQNPSTGEPTEDQFDNYADYLEARTLYKLLQQMQPQAPEQPQMDPQQIYQQQAYLAQRQQAIAVRAEQLKAEIPDYAEVTDTASEILSYLPPHVTEAFLQADDAALAFYNLAKSDKLYDLMDAPPLKAAMMIAQAQMQPAAPVPARQVTQAPKPIRGVSAGGQGGSSSIIDKSPDELLKWIQS